MWPQWVLERHRLRWRSLVCVALGPVSRRWVCGLRVRISLITAIVRRCALQLWRVSARGDRPIVISTTTASRLRIVCLHIGCRGRLDGVCLCRTTDREACLRRSLTILCCVVFADRLLWIVWTVRRSETMVDVKRTRINILWALHCSERNPNDEFVCQTPVQTIKRQC